MAAKPTVLVTRKLPDAVHARLSRDYDARLNPDDKLYTKDALVAAARENGTQTELDSAVKLMADMVAMGGEIGLSDVAHAPAP